MEWPGQKTVTFGFPVEVNICEYLGIFVEVNIWIACRGEEAKVGVGPVD